MKVEKRQIELSDSELGLIGKGLQAYMTAKDCYEFAGVAKLYTELVNIEK